MLTCGTCKVKGANSYSKVTNGQMLFNILIKLNPTIVYYPKNSYFCDKCIAVATKKLDDAAAIMSDQNADGLSLTTTTSESKVSSDKEASHVASPVKKIFKPCPKRFKQQAACIVPGRIIGQATMTTSSSDSESVSESDVLLNVERGDNRTEKPDSCKTVDDVSVQQEHAIVVEDISDYSGSLEGQVSVKEEHSIVVEDISNFTGSVEGNLSVEDEQHSVAVGDISASVEGSIAPVTRNSTIREPIVNVTGDVQAYFQEGQAAINVNHYSRSVAG